jgi:hypothetical protein
MTQDNVKWYVHATGPRPYGDAEISTTVGDMPVTVGFAGIDDARRIVAAVNATSALSTESLDAGAVDKLLRFVIETANYEISEPNFAAQDLLKEIGVK